MSLSSAALKKAGSEPSARWTIGDNENFMIVGNLPNESGLYLFVANNQIKYVGMADKSLHVRIYRYLATMNTSWPNEWVPREVYMGLREALNGRMYKSTR